jgi:arginine decarboxylase
LAIIPQKLFLTKGVGVDKEKLSSFELALRAAGIAGVNLVHVSSIFPPNCKLISKKQGLDMLQPGQIVYCVISRNETNEPNRLISASVGLAIPNDRSQYGYLSEHVAFGQTERISGDYAEDLAAGMLASTLGIEFDVDKSYDEKKEIYKISGKIVRTTNSTQSARGNKLGLWTTVVSAAIFIGY